MNNKVIEFNKSLRGEKKIDFEAGDVVKVRLKIKEGEKERVQIFEGLVIAVKAKQSASPTITVRKISNGVGVEMIVPILSKNVEGIELIKKAKVRRAKLYYVRGLTAKQSRMKYKDIKDYGHTSEKAAAPEQKQEGDAVKDTTEEKSIEVEKDAKKKEASKEKK